MKYPNCNMTVDLCKGIILSAVLFLIPFLMIPNMEFGFCVTAAHFRQIVHYDSQTPLFMSLPAQIPFMHVYMKFNFFWGGSSVRMHTIWSRENITHLNYKFNLKDWLHNNYSLAYFRFGWIAVFGIHSKHGRYQTGKN